LRPWLAREPGRFFLATKTMQRTAAGAREDLHRSLDRMGVDRVDLWQLHALADPLEWDTALSPGGTIEAAVAAREEGLVRWIGVTGHGSQIAATHLRSLERFDFDSVVLPYSYLTMRLPYYAENFEAVYRTCRQRGVAAAGRQGGVAVQPIKPIAARHWRDRPHTWATWYQPLDRQPDIDLAVWWVLARPGVFLNSASDVDLAARVLDAASRFTEPPAEADLAALMDRTQSETLFV